MSERHTCLSVCLSKRKQLMIDPLKSCCPSTIASFTSLTAIFIHRSDPIDRCGGGRRGATDVMHFLWSTRGHHPFTMQWGSSPICFFLRSSGGGMFLSIRCCAAVWPAQQSSLWVTNLTQSSFVFTTNEIGGE